MPTATRYRAEDYVRLVARGSMLRWIPGNSENLFALEVSRLPTIGVLVHSFVSSPSISNILPSSSVFLALAEKYGIEHFFGRMDRTELRYASSFPDYVRAFCDRWLAFSDVVFRRRGNALIEIGYAAQEDALQWLERQLPNVRLVRGPQRHGHEEGKTYYSLSLGDDLASVAFLSNVLVTELKNTRDPAVVSIAGVAETFGVFLSGDSCPNMLTSVASEEGYHD